MTPLDRIRARLSPAQVNMLADLLDEISEGGSFVASFRAKRGRNAVINAKFAKDVEVGWPQSDGQGELPLNGKTSPLTRST